MSLIISAVFFTERNTDLKAGIVTVPRPASFPLSHHERAKELRNGCLMCLGLDGSPSAACELKVRKHFIIDLTSEAVGAFNSTSIGCIVSHRKCKDVFFEKGQPCKTMFY